MPIFIEIGHFALLKFQAMASHHLLSVVAVDFGKSYLRISARISALVDEICPVNIYA